VTVQTDTIDARAAAVSGRSKPAAGNDSAAVARAADKLRERWPARKIVAKAHRRFYLSTFTKYCIALILASAWLVFSIRLSLPWEHDLADLIGTPLALFILIFVAYIPGLMNMFVVVTMISDRRPHRHTLENYPPVSVLVACYNEGEHIRDTLISLSKESYSGKLEIIVIDDGSRDNSLAIARATAAELQRANVRIRVLSMKKNGGKAAALNYGLARSSSELIVTVDDDTRLNRSALSCIVERFISDPPGTVAVAGTVFVGNAHKNLLCQMQKWDYFHSIAAVKRMQSMYHGTLVAQGAFSLYTRRVLQSVGGWPECIGEDIVLTWSILAQGHRVGYCESSIVFTNVPETIKQFARQRQRWSRGLVEAFHRHWRLLFRRRLTTIFIWWNLLFLPMDVAYTFAFIPGVILALFGYYHIAGPMTLIMLPAALLCHFMMFRLQARLLNRHEMSMEHRWRGLFLFATSYSMLLQPVCVWGYIQEIFKMRKTWGTK
jgi:biofilm PGA synthesis N-glycosyltransferase PgaC